MLEKHPYGEFVPENAQYLILGSFPGKKQPGNNWFYSSPRNQFWPILEKVYGRKLDTKVKKQRLLADLKTAMADIILSCERKKKSNLDMNLTNITYNTSGVQEIVKNNDIEKIYFSSRFVEEGFKKHFKTVRSEFLDDDLMYLPSPSPRYAGMDFSNKVKRYKDLLPCLN